VALEKEIEGNEDKLEKIENDCFDCFVVAV
jgi:hypothetical protein